MTCAHIFNQYYFDLLRKLRAIARDHRLEDKAARDILKAIKRSYLSWDKTSADYRDWFASSEAFGDDLAAYESAPDAAAWDAWLTSERQMYKGITLAQVANLIGAPPVFHHFLTVLCIFRRDHADSSAILQAVKGAAEVPEGTSDDVKQLVARLKVLQEQRRASSAAGPAAAAALAGIEDTSLGKLAKEIMGEINVDELQNSMSADGDILKSMANPDSGLMKILGTVSQKMISKMASGEIQQETLLQDALKFASSMGLGGGAPGRGGAAGGLGALTQMMSGLMGGGGGAGPNLSSRRHRRHKKKNVGQ